MQTLMDRIDVALRAGCDSQTKADLLGEKACYLARSGDFHGAQLVVHEMRSEWGGGDNARAMVWIMLAEGLIAYYDRLGDGALDRIRRASLIARMASLPRLLPLTLAWMAQIEFFRSNFESMGQLIRECRSSPGADSGDVQLRIAIILADASLYAGRFMRSKAFFETAHLLAVKSLDRAAIGAMIFNRAVFGVSRVIVDSVLGNQPVEESSLRRYELELKSAAAFDELSGARAFGEQVDIYLCRASLARGDYQSAQALALKIEAGPIQARAEQAFGRFIGDRALCAAGLGQGDRSRTLLQEFLSMEASEIDADERLIEVFFAARAAKLLELTDLQPTLEVALTTARISFFQEVRHVELALDSASMGESDV